MKLLRFYGPWVAFMVLLFQASSLPGARAAELEAPDYVLHAAAYMTLGVLTVRAFASGLAEPRSLWVLASAFGFSVLYGVSDEWHQSFVPGRDPSARDVAWDAAGAFAATAAVGLFWRWRQRRGARGD